MARLHRFTAVTTVLLSVMATTPIATAAEKQVTSIEHVTGPWYECVYERDIRVMNMAIRSDGVAHFTFQGNPTLYADIDVRDGVLYWGNRRPKAGWNPVRLVEDRGKEYLTFFMGSHSRIWMECARPARPQ